MSEKDEKIVERMSKLEEIDLHNARAKVKHLRRQIERQTKRLAKMESQAAAYRENKEKWTKRIERLELILRILIERAERVQEGEGWDLVELILRYKEEVDEG